MTNLLAISGRIGSGKDTVAKIIQYLSSASYHKHDMTFDEFNDIFLEPDKVSGWKVKKFADTLKDIVCLLIGCTREQLEDNEFKSKPLGEEWRRWYYTHYKLKTNKNNGRVSPYFSSREDAMLYEFPKVNEQPVWGKDALWIEDEVLNARKILQLTGTEFGRELLTPNIWVNSLFSEYKPKDAPYKNLGDLLEDKHHGLLNNPKWIVTDLRFPNELQAIKERGGIIIRVNRLNKELLDTDEKFSNEFNKFHHPSETTLDNADFDYVLDNNDTIEDLIEKVEEILIHFKII